MRLTHPHHTIPVVLCTFSHYCRATKKKKQDEEKEISSHTLEQFKAAPDLSLTLGIRTQRFHANTISGQDVDAERAGAARSVKKSPPPPPGSSGMRCCGSIASLSKDCSPRLTSLSEIYKTIFSGPLISCAAAAVCCKRGARKGTSRRRRRPDEEKKRKERAEKGKWQRSIMRNARTCARI